MGGVVLGDPNSRGCDSGGSGETARPLLFSSLLALSWGDGGGDALVRSRTIFCRSTESVLCALLLFLGRGGRDTDGVDVDIEVDVEAKRKSHDFLSSEIKFERLSALARGLKDDPSCAKDSTFR